MNAIILMTSRSGSSLVAKIFAAHGFWYGSSGSGGDYPSFENVEVKNFLRKVPMTRGEFVDKVPGLPFNPECEPWFWKGGIEYWPLFEDIPAQRVLVRRSTEAIVQSIIRRRYRGAAPFSEIDAARSLVKRRQKMLDEVGGIDVFTAEVVHGDYRTVQNAIEACGVEFQPKLAEQAIRPEMWHG